MKGARVGLVAVAALMFLFSATAALAFHDGGVATCTRCHSIHNAKSSQSTLLAAVDASSTCLNCHEGSAGSYRVSTATANAGAGVAPAQRTPGGDFRWLSKTYSWTLPRPGTNNGREHGHNIVAAGTNSSSAPYGYVADTGNTTAPGGTMASSGLGCTNCHDPHGQTRRDENGAYINPGDPLFTATSYPPIEGSGSYPVPAVPDAGYALGAYRLLRGPGSRAFGSTNFPGAPIAIAPATYNQGEATDQVRVAYGRPVSAPAGAVSWAQWCGTCHPNYHTTVPGGTFVHPADGDLTDVVDNYNKYVKTGDLSGTDATSFNSLVPFAENTDDYSVLAGHASNTDGFLNGPAASDTVTCLSCHRAHASAWDNALRWNQSAEFITLANETTGVPEYAAAGGAHADEGQFHRGYSQAEMTAAYYDRPASVFAGYQRSLCNKCHIKD